ncbi:MAG TPA: fatty acid desaturase [Flavobacteriales bacterium]|nr:fatty acid desaturase [Flavobacteriales bacterium]
MNVSNEKELILATKPYAKEVRWKSWWHLFSTGAVLAGFFSGIFIPKSPLWLKSICSVFAGLTIARMFIIYHDHQHKAILQNSKFADAVMTLWGLFILAPTSIWKRSHDHHHTHNSKLYTSSIGSYPIVTVEKYKTFSKKERTVYKFIRHPLTITFGYLFVFMYGMCIRSFVNNRDKHWDSLLSLILHLAIGVTIVLTLGWTTFWLGFIAPAMIALGLGAYLFYAQHNFPTATFSDKEGWSYVNAALGSSSYMKMNPVLHWFTGNIGFHHIHHLNARIPFYRLPEVFRAIPELQHAKTTSLMPGEIIRCLRLKVWDPSKGRMISFREMAV